MSVEEIEKLGITFIGSKLYPRKFFVPYAGEFIIPESDTIPDIYRRIYEHGVKHGVERGKELKIKEIKNILQIFDNEE